MYSIFTDECSPCKQFVKLKCHCDMVSLHIFCEQICSKTKELLDKPNSSQVPQVTTPEIESQVLDALKSCQNDCPKKMTCGHACQKLCHSGDCSNSLLCNKKVSVRCDCKRIKQVSSLCSILFEFDCILFTLFILI